MSAAPSKAPPPPPPPPPPEDPPAEEDEDEDEEEEFFLPFDILGHPVKIPKLPVMPDWLRAIAAYRFPSSIDQFTGERHTHEDQC